jgi:regulator of sigma E protease
VSWLLAFLGFAVLIILHELGHFAAAKAVGMRVERFALFFPPLIARYRRGETEYAVGAIPLGGYVKITGMNPAEKIPPELADRAYFRQPVWKRIVVIAAGPVVNIVLAFAIFTGIALHLGEATGRTQLEELTAGAPAAKAGLREGDVILSVDGERDRAKYPELIASHTCAGEQRVGCQAREPVVIAIQRGEERRRVQVTPRHSASDPPARPRIGVVFGPERGPIALPGAMRVSLDQMWAITSGTVSTIAQIFKPEKREQISGVVGNYEVTRQAIELSAVQAIFLLGVISLSLGVINLFPFLPLDGGHIFWAVVEKVRGRSIPLSVMERAGFVGFALVIALFMIGFTNDIGRLTGEGFDVR